ncbi:MAG: TlyA family RNA methyltransferase [Clostridia bacterium]|nr:TlyA family RNA methyltransferase [Clostridia bacterium]
MRLDVYLFTYGHCKSRQKAKALIEGNSVTINGRIINKPSFDIDEAQEYNISINDTCPYVSRGGLKLKAIIDYAKISANNLVCIDIGASTGGFTDCLIKEGAKRVYAVDTGENQLDSTLQANDKVVYLENFNARNLTPDSINESVDLICIDVSFISQTLILPTVHKLLKQTGVYLSLIKPQFEVGRENISKGGIVKNKKHHSIAIEKVINCAQDCGLVCTHLIKSPIEGGDGNIEYLGAFSKVGKPINKSIIKSLISH